jgi:hypothetical protein
MGCHYGTGGPHLFYSGRAIDPFHAEISKSSENSELFASCSASNSSKVDPVCHLPLSRFTVIAVLLF